MLKIAILGSTSHIARSLINLIQDSELFLYSRSSGFQDFYTKRYDLVLNCVGTGVLNNEYHKWFTLTEEFDNLIINYLLNISPECVYVSFSSGTVYGKSLNIPTKNSTQVCICPNSLNPSDYHTISKLNSEAKHRAFNDLNIVDIRVFNYFSRFINLDDPYFMSEIVKCVKLGNKFVTNNSDFIKDFANPLDLLTLIKSVVGKRINKAIDLFSKKPITKFEIIKLFQDKYNLEVEIKENFSGVNGTGEKAVYFSNNKTEDYIPKFDSEYTILTETERILEIT